MDPAHTPAGVPPAGQTTNFVDPPSRQTIMIAISTVAIVLATSFVSIRVYSSLRLTRSLGREDWLCLVATVFSFGYIGIILSLACVSRHIWDVPVIWFTESYWKYRFAGNTLQALAYFTSRLPILLLYLRLFGTQRPFRYAVYIAIAAAAGLYITSIPLISYFCTPPPGGDWGSLDVFAKCQRLLDWALVQGSGDVALNVYIILLPIAPIVRLQMPLNKKLGVLAIFLTGLLVVEINIAIICSCMPALASYMKNISGDSKFLVSLRSILSRFTFSSPSQGSVGQVKYSDSSSVRDRGERERRFYPHYVETRAVVSFVGTDSSYNTDAVRRSPNPDPYQPGGIRKTITVDVV
ncbi:hypothetical protein ANO14919_050570 [Xylariales sp. No.14919]|nr:hypothetical protein ANO14919_050570 [Xylariales sp. No.14919]